MSMRNPLPLVGIPAGYALDEWRAGHRVAASYVDAVFDVSGCMAVLVPACGEKHDFALVKGLLSEQLDDILRLRKEAGILDDGMEQRYRDAVRVSKRWIHNYTEFNFRSLGTYTRADLAEIAAAQDAF